jgi:hypothetical protein
MFAEISKLIKKAIRRIYARGPRYLSVGIASNGISFFWGLTLYHYLNTLIGVALVTVISCVSHITLTFSAQYFLTFNEREGYLRGLSRAFIASISTIIILSAVNSFLMWLNFAPYWIIQSIMTIGGQAYSLIINALWVFPENPTQQRPQINSDS